MRTVRSSIQVLQRKPCDQFYFNCQCLQLGESRRGHARHPTRARKGDKCAVTDIAACLAKLADPDWCRAVQIDHRLRRHCRLRHGPGFPVSKVWLCAAACSADPDYRRACAGTDHLERAPKFYLKCRHTDCCFPRRVSSRRWCSYRQGGTVAEFTQVVEADG